MQNCSIVTIYVRIINPVDVLIEEGFLLSLVNTTNTIFQRIPHDYS
jgi:hypothetical protein